MSVARRRSVAWCVALLPLCIDVCESFSETIMKGRMNGKEGDGERGRDYWRGGKRTIYSYL